MKVISNKLIVVICCFSVITTLRLSLKEGHSTDSLTFYHNNIRSLSDRRRDEKTSKTNTATTPTAAPTTQAATPTTPAATPTTSTTPAATPTTPTTPAATPTTAPTTPTTPAVTPGKDQTPQTASPTTPATAPVTPGKDQTPSHTSTNVVGSLSTSDVIVDKAPYAVSKCDQVVMINANRITNLDDYTSKAPAFFTLSAYLINMFESKDSNKLLESINLAHIKQSPKVLKGSKFCLAFEDSVSSRKIPICLENEETYNAINKAYSDFITCRKGSDLQGFDPATVDNIIKAACNGFGSTTGVKYDLPAIRASVTAELKKAGVY